MSYVTERHESTEVNGQIITKDSVLLKRRSKKGEDYPDDYIMLYVRMIGAINRIPPTANPILNALLRRVTPAHNGQAIILNGVEIQHILKECNIKKTAFYENMKTLVEYQVIFPTYTDEAKTKWSYASTFYLNPYMFGYGNWSDIKNLRSYIEVNEQGLSLLTETSSEPSITALPEGTQQRLFRIEGDYFGLPEHNKEEEYAEEDERETILRQIEGNC